MWKIPDISQKSENGGNAANVHVSGSEHLNQTLTRLSRPHTSRDTQIPAGACPGRMLFKARSFEKRGIRATGPVLPTALASQKGINTPGLDAAVCRVLSSVDPLHLKAEAARCIPVRGDRSLLRVTSPYITHAAQLLRIAGVSEKLKSAGRMKDEGVCLFLLPPGGGCC